MTDETNAEPLAVEAGKVVPAQQPETLPADPTAELTEDEQQEADEVAKKRESSIQKLKRQREEARRETDYWKREALRQKPAEQPAQVAKPSADGKPSPDAFGTVGEYFEALADWKAEQKLTERDQRSEKAKAAEQQKEQLKSWQTKASEARRRYADFEETLAEDVAISQPMHELILSSEVGPDVAYFLGKNPAEAERIATLAPLAAAREIGKIEARFAKDAEKPASARAASNAPAPINPVSRASKAEADPDRMTTSEWLAWRQKQVRSQRKRA